MPTKKEALVSVIIPCCNQAHFLGDAIESAINQTYPHVEVVVVDDGSTDDTLAVAEKYPCVRAVRQENRGLSAARNSGIRESRGQYLIFLDSDDRLLPDAVETGVNCLDAHPACAFVYGYCNYISSNGSPIPARHLPRVEAEHYLALLRKNIICNPATVMYRRSVFDEVADFDTSVSPAADYDLYLRISREFPIYCHGHFVSEYRQHSANMSRNSALMLASTLTVLRSQRRYLTDDRRYMDAYKSGVKSWQEFYGDQLVNTVRACVRERTDLRRALKGVLTLLRYHPRGLFRHAAQKLYCTAFGIRQ